MNLVLPPALDPSSLSAKDRLRLIRLGFGGLIVLGHVGVVLALSQAQPQPPDIEPVIIQVELFRPAPPPAPPPPPPQEPAPESGGGRPAAPSRIHVTPPPKRPVERELPTPIVQAPEPDPIVVGAADTRSPTPDLGQGGVGTGTGTGRGAGSGPGTGERSGPRNLRRPSMAEVRRYHPPEAMRARINGAVTVRCRIGQDTRLQRCRVIREDPPGYGFGEAAIRVAIETYRFRPATLDGAYDDSVDVNVEVNFGPPQRPRG